MRRLRVTSGPAAGQSFDAEVELVIGREGVDVTINDPEISPRHTIVRPHATGVSVEDLGSTNGTFVDGKRITGWVALGSGGRIRLGGTELRVDLEADATVVTASALSRGTARPVEDESPVTIAPFAAPEQPVAAAAGRAPSAPAARPTAEPRPRQPVAPPPEPPRRAQWIKWALPLGAVAGGAAVTSLLFLVLGGGDETRKRPLRADLTTGLLAQTPTTVTFAGTVTQSPGGEGLVSGELRLVGDLLTGKPAALSAKMVFRFEGGRIDSTVNGMAIPQPDKTVSLVGTGTIDGGTGEFDGAKGSFTFKSGQEARNPTIGHPRIRGSIEY